MSGPVSGAGASRHSAAEIDRPERQGIPQETGANWTNGPVGPVVPHGFDEDVAEFTTLARRARMPIVGVDRGFSSVDLMRPRDAVRRWGGGLVGRYKFSDVQGFGSGW